MKNRSVFFLVFLALVLILSILIKLNFAKYKPIIYKNSPERLKAIYKVIFGESDISGIRNRSYILKKIKNDYNVKFLPDTQFEKISLKKVEISSLSEVEGNYSRKSKFLTFYIEIVEDQLWIIDSRGNFFRVNIENIIKNEKVKNFDQNKINSNLSSHKVLDTLVYDKNIYISFSTTKDNCQYLNISYAKINNKYLKFKKLFSSNECGKRMYAGKMQFFIHKEKKGLLLTAADVRGDKPTYRPQSDKSIFGKILFIDYESGNSEIFSRGHRNPAGLYAENNLILSTEHGPKGGDEINKIEFNKNYGWPIASYGDLNKKNNNIKPSYAKEHSSLGFEEPIFSFIPAIGISEIIKLPNDFSNFWVDNYLISSLWGQSLFRVKFGENYNKILFHEKIFIGQRIRDLIYHKKLKAILLALEEFGELGIITLIDK